MGAAEAPSAAKVLSMVIVALNMVGVEAPAHTAAQDASQNSALAGRPTPLHQLCKSAQTRPAVQQPASPAKAQLMATAARNMAIVEAQVIIAVPAARQVLELVVNLRQGIHQVHLALHHPPRQRCH
jgi:hypothetical protein